MLDITFEDIKRVVAEIEREDENRQNAVRSVLFLSNYFDIDANKLMSAIKNIK